jgi:3-methyladenine DNA glycosylase AlkD
MQFFPVIPQVDQQVDRAIQQIKLRKNGETADMLKRMGMVYRFSYGASLVHIRQIAAAMPRNNDVANRLWARDIREAMILATLVADINQMPIETLVEWSRMVVNAELTEQTSMNLYARSPKIIELCEVFAASDSPFVKGLAYFSLGWAVKFNTVTLGDAEAMAVRLIDTCTFDHVVLGRGFSHLLRQLVRGGEAGKQMANSWLAANGASDSLFVQVANAEIAQEIDFANNQ